MKLNLLVLVPLCLLFAQTGIIAQPITQEGHIKAALRLIGHEVLQSAGDDTSRVLPVTAENARYKIAFDAEFQLNSEKLVSIVDSVVQHFNIAHSYLVDVEECESHDLIYSYEFDGEQDLSMIPCQRRNQPKTCYQIYFTILQPGSTVMAYKANTSEEETSGFIRNKNYFIFGSGLLLFALFFFFRKRKPAQLINKNVLSIGEYQFDKRNMELTFKGQKVELTAKEADLLYLLYSSANNTLERDVIIKTVWGDVGDYVGRTLDVFISKLRKKLEEDATVKIVNVRGIGYKLVVNNL